MNYSSQIAVMLADKITAFIEATLRFDQVHPRKYTRSAKKNVFAA
jgi:hypothetical protein